MAIRVLAKILNSVETLGNDNVTSQSLKLHENFKLRTILKDFHFNKLLIKDVAVYINLKYENSPFETSVSHLLLNLLLFSPKVHILSYPVGSNPLNCLQEHRDKVFNCKYVISKLGSWQLFSTSFVKIKR